jgi:uncharacterized protein
MTKTLNFHLLRVVSIAVVLAGAAVTGAAYAVDLQQAKSQGLVGEKPDGYLGLVATNAPVEVKQLVADINQQRKSSYQEIARRNNTSLQAVEALAGKKAIEKTSPNHLIQLPSGQWVKK